MNRRRREILNLLFNLEGYITGSRLASNYGVSLSTVRSDIKGINQELEVHEVKIESQVKQGYYLSSQSKQAIRENNIIRTIIDREYINQMPLTPIERQMYFLLQLTKKDSVDLEILASELYVSVSTLTNDINSARKWLKDKLDLTFRFSLVEGVRLDCLEKEKRNLIIWIIVNNTNSSSVSKYWHLLTDGEGSQIVKNNETLFMVINESAYQHGYILSGHSVVIVATAIGLFLERNRSGFFHQNQEPNRKLTPVMAHIKDQVEQRHQIRLPESDWLLVEDYFMAGQFLRGTDLNMVATEQSDVIAVEFFNKVRSKFGVDLEKSSNLAADLKLYLITMHNRTKSRFPIANVLEFDFKESYHLESAMAALLKDMIFTHWQIPVSEMEMGYLTLHLVATREQWLEPVKAMVVCDYDQGVRNLIENLIVAKTKNRIKIVTWNTYQEFVLSKVPEIDSIDMVISTATLKDRTNLPLIVINPEMLVSDSDKTIANIDALIADLHRDNN